MALKVINNLALNLSPNSVLPPFIQLFMEYVQSTPLRQKIAFLALANVVEGCLESIISDLDHFMPIVSNCCCCCFLLLPCLSMVGFDCVRACVRARVHVFVYIDIQRVDVNTCECSQGCALRFGTIR